MTRKTLLKSRVIVGGICGSCVFKYHVIFVNMLVLLLSALAFLGLMTGSFLITYYVFGILNQGASDSEPSINDITSR